MEEVRFIRQITTESQLWWGTKTSVVVSVKQSTLRKFWTLVQAEKEIRFHYSKWRHVQIDGEAMDALKKEIFERMDILVDENLHEFSRGAVDRTQKQRRMNAGHIPSARNFPQRPFVNRVDPPKGRANREVLITYVFISSVCFQWENPSMFQNVILMLQSVGDQFVFQIGLATISRFESRVTI